MAASAKRVHIATMGLRASLLVNAKSLRTNERMERNGVQRNERAVFLLPSWKEQFLEHEKCSEWKRYEVRLERTAINGTFFLEL